MQHPEKDGIFYYRTANIGLAGYLKIKGAKLKSIIEINERSYTGVFVFAGEKEMLDSLAIDFFNSESKEHDDAVAGLKLQVRQAVNNKGKPKYG